MTNRFWWQAFVTLGLLVLPSHPVAPAGEACVVENGHLGYRLSISDGRLVGRQFENRLTGKNLALPVEEFLLEFQDGTRVGSQQCVVKMTRRETGASLLFSHPSGFEVQVRYELGADKPYLRKQIAVRRTGSGPRLMQADLENWKGVQAAWASMRADRHPFGSHPIYCDDLWAGVEFVVAMNEYGAEGFVLRSRPGGLQVGDAWRTLHSTVIGVAERGQVRSVFLRYVEDIRLSPPRMTCCYNSWWTLPKRFTEQDLLGLAAELKQRLFDRHGVFFDVVAVDAGWSEPQSIWKISRQYLPQGFEPLRRVVESAHGRLGLWISPSAFYTLATDCDWAEQNGYTVVRYPVPPSKRHLLTGISLADPAYLSAAKEQLKRLVRENRFAHVKLDGLIPLEESPHHDLLPGRDSVEPLAEASLQLLSAAKEADPQVVTEPTYLNSWFTYISPWMIRYADTLFGNAGGDYPRAIGPAPDYRESCTNAREWYIFSSLDEIWLPQNALQYFDIIHCDAADGLVNHLAMAVGRGRFFLPVYVNPKYVSDAEWEALAGLLRWARSNQGLLRHTVVLPSRVERGETYCYAHWCGRRGLLVLRNPSNATQVYSADLKAAGAPRELADAVCYTQYPNRRGIAADLTATSVVPLRLQPWETAFVEIVPRPELREPVAIGGRWWRQGQGKMSVCPDRGVRKLEVLGPGGLRLTRPANAAPDDLPRGKLLARTVSPLPKTQWLTLKDKPQPSCKFELDCSLWIPQGSDGGKVLLLLESPRSHVPSTVSAEVGAKSLPLETRTSAGQQGYAGGTHGFDPKSYWAGMIPYAVEWTWYLGELKPGESRVRFTGRVARPEARIGLWVWSERDCFAGREPLDLACTPPEMPQWRDRLHREGVCVVQPEQ